MGKCKSESEAVRRLMTGDCGVDNPGSETKAWYAVYTKSQHEKSAAAQLERKDFEIFLPLYRTVHRWKDRNQLVSLPLFPNYLFARTELDRKVDLLRTLGVHWLVENAGRACVLRDEEIEAVKRVCADGNRIHPHPFIRQGDSVRIRSGPLLGVCGMLSQIKNQYRVVISVELLQRSVAVEVDFADIEVLGSRQAVAPTPLEMASRFG